MTERARNIVVAVVLAGVAALLVGLYVTNYQRNVQEGEDHVTVYVATRDIPAGTPGASAVAQGMVGERTVARRSVVPGAVSGTAQISEWVAAQQIFEGEQITNRRFTEQSLQGIHGQLKGTLRAFQVQGDPNQLLVGTLRKGDHVDVVATFRYKVGDATFAATRTVLRDITVLKPASGGGTDAKVTNGFNDGSKVILAVTDAQAQKLDFTRNVTENEGANAPGWALTLRSPVKSSDSPESLTTLDSVLTDGLSDKQRSRLNGKYEGNR